jgi:hypothetical protein
MGIEHLDQAFRFLKAPDYAPLCSNAIRWMGTKKVGKNKNGSEKTSMVSFTRSKILAASKGVTNTLELSFRKSAESNQ